MATAADTLTGHDLQLIAAVLAAYPDATAFEIAAAIYDGRPFEQLEKLIRVYLAGNPWTALAALDATDPLLSRALDGDR